MQNGRKVCSIVCVQNMHSLATRADEAALIQLADEGTAYVPFFPIGGFTPLPSDALSEVAKALGATPMQVALAWRLQRSAQRPADPWHLIGRTPSTESGSSKPAVATRCSGKAGRAGCSAAGSHPLIRSSILRPPVHRSEAFPVRIVAAR